MADIVTYGPDGTPISSRPDKDRNLDTWGSRAEAGEYIETPERQEAERIKQLQADLNAKGSEQIQDAMTQLGLGAKWLPLFRQKMNQHGWITDYSFDDFTVTFEGKPSQFTGGYNEHIWDLSSESEPQPDYEGRN